MVDRITKRILKNHERWPRDWENICREGDENQLRRYIQSHKFDALTSNQKINLIKCIVISVPNVRIAEDLLRTALFGKTAECRLRPDAFDANGSTIAHFAAQRENPAPLFRCLKDLGTPLARTNKVGMSTLHFLFFKTGPRQVRNLREAASYLCKQPRCNIDLRDNEGETPLLVACLRKDPMSALTVLREIGADMQMKTRNNQTALHLVASSCAPYELERATKFLIQNDVDPGHLDDDGKTMMHYINERSDINNQQKDLINNLFNPYHSVSFSPRTSSGFSEKMSIDYCEGGPDSPFSTPLNKQQADRRYNQFFNNSQTSSTSKVHYYHSANSDSSMNSSSSSSSGHFSGFSQPLPTKTTQNRSSPMKHSTPKLLPPPPPSAFDSTTRRDILPQKIHSSNNQNLQHSNLSSPMTHANDSILSSPPNPSIQGQTTTTTSRYYAQDQQPNRPPTLLLLPKPTLRRNLDFESTNMTPKETQTIPCNCEKMRDQDNELEILRLRMRDMEMEKKVIEEKYKKCTERLDRYESCQICMESFNINNRTTLKSCGHMMCSDCAFKWLSTEPEHSPSYSPEYDRITSDHPNLNNQNHALCPVCRTPYDQNDLVKSLIS